MQTKTTSPGNPPLPSPTFVRRSVIAAPRPTSGAAWSRSRRSGGQEAIRVPGHRVDASARSSKHRRHRRRPATLQPPKKRPASPPRAATEVVASVWEAARRPFGEGGTSGPARPAMVAFLPDGGARSPRRGEVRFDPRARGRGPPPGSDHPREERRPPDFVRTRSPSSSRTPPRWPYRPRAPPWHR